MLARCFIKTAIVTSGQPQIYITKCISIRYLLTNHRLTRLNPLPQVHTAGSRERVKWLAAAAATRQEWASRLETVRAEEASLKPRVDDLAGVL